jgi:hypothetical protein
MMKYKFCTEVIEDTAGDNYNLDHIKIYCTNCCERNNYKDENEQIVN